MWGLEPSVALSTLHLVAVWMTMLADCRQGRGRGKGNGGRRRRDGNGAMRRKDKITGEEEGRVEVRMDGRGGRMDGRGGEGREERRRGEQRGGEGREERRGGGDKKWEWGGRWLDG